MTALDTEESREFRRARLHAIRPMAAHPSYSERDYRAQFMRYQIVAREHMPSVEKNTRAMFCPACQIQFNNSMVKARWLHVTYEQDHLRNFPAIANVHCQGCGWEELIPLVAPEVTEEQRILARRWNRAKGTSADAARGLLSPDLISKQLMESYKGGLTSPLGDTVAIGPGMIHRADVASEQQQLANKAWNSFNAAETVLRDAALCTSQLETVERIEAEERAAVSNRTALKNGMMGQMYGMGQAQFQNQLQQAQNMMGKQLMDQMSSYGLDAAKYVNASPPAKCPPPPALTIHDEITEFKSVSRKTFDAIHKRIRKYK